MFDFKKIANEQDWTPRTQVDLLLEYIENQQSDEAFRDFILEIADEQTAK